jgi:hypothetical protein
MRVHLTAEHALELQVPHRGLEALTIALDLSRRWVIGLADRQLQQLRVIGNGGRRAVDFLDVGAQAGAFAPELLGARGVRPDGRILQLAADFLEPLTLAVVLKETPVALTCARRDL